jgi:hypothetical protein
VAKRESLLELKKMSHERKRVREMVRVFVFVFVCVGVSLIGHAFFKLLRDFACLQWHQPSGVVEFDGFGFFPFGVFPHSLLIPFFSIFFYMKYSSVKTLKSTDKFPLYVSSEWEFLFVFCVLLYERERENYEVAGKAHERGSLKDINVRYEKAFHDTILNPMI